jgi:hypothetical protein
VLKQPSFSAVMTLTLQPRQAASVFAKYNTLQGNWKLMEMYHMNDPSYHAYIFQKQGTNWTVRTVRALLVKTSDQAFIDAFLLHYETWPTDEQLEEKVQHLWGLL